jgi:hypothetical protein
MALVKDLLALWREPKAPKRPDSYSAQVEYRAAPVAG